MRRLVLSLLPCLLLCCAAYAQFIPPGFPPGTFQSRGALDASAACTPATALNFDFTGGTLPGGITFTRASSGSYFNSSNVLQVYGATTDAPRFDYMISGATPTLLYEPAATNLLLQSNAFTTTWSNANGMVSTAAAATSPDGTADAWSQITAASSYGAVLQSVTYNGTSKYVVSGYLQKDNANTGGAIGPTGFTVGFTATTSWVRYFSNNTPTAGAINTFVIGANGSPAVGVYVFGAQSELTPTSLTTGGPTSYIPTVASTVTRAADQATFAIPSCVGHLTVTFSDNTTQSIAVTPGAGSYTLTNSLNLFNIKSIVGAA